MDKARELMGRFKDSYKTTNGVEMCLNAPEWVNELSCSLDCSQKVEWEIAQRLCGASDLWEVHISSICQSLVDVGNADLLDWVRADLSREEFIEVAVNQGRRSLEHGDYLWTWNIHDSREEEVLE